MRLIEAAPILDCKPNKETAEHFRKVHGLAEDQELIFIVFRAKFNEKTFYCSWSGGELLQDDVAFTMIGKAAFECLVNLPVGNKDMIFQELKIGPTPLLVKVTALFEKLPDQSRICFIGDMAQALDGKIGTIFNLKNPPVFIYN